MRRRRAEPRIVPPDPVYGEVLVTKMINKVMWDGKKSIAQKIVYGAIEILEQKTGKNGIEIFKQAIENVKPVVEVRPRRIGGATYQVPVEVQEPRKTTLAIRWIVDIARSKKGKPMKEKLAEELLNAYNNTGAAIKKREDVHKMAEANRAFAHFRW
ncbi:MAG: 30S ribosomal protein S7 [Fervidobacterium sp.]|nr:30S ribosomal protein S7 [Fervidobacterium sp.]